MTKKLIVSFAILLAPIQSLAWGPVGHYTVGLLAQERLTPDADKAVKNLLGRETLADVANWADAMRGDHQYPQSNWYHFEKIPNNTSFLDNLKQMPDWQKKKGGVVAAILYGRELLRNPQTSKATRADALKFIVHFVGDVHQPLHTGTPEDKGGVTKDVEWFGRPMNLHRIWDSGMMMTGHSNLMNYSRPVPQNSQSYATYLKRTFTPNSVTSGLDVEGWLNESMALRPEAYDPSYLHDQAKYQAQHLKTLDQRIYAAGIRLADLLNDTFANKPLPPAAAQLWKDIESVSAQKMDQLINFSP